MKRLLAASLLSFYLIPLAAIGRPAGSAGSPPAGLRVSGRTIARLPRDRRPAGHPAATAPVLVPINTSWLGADGQTYVLSGTLTLSGGATPTPPPPPLPTVNLSYLTMAPASVTAGQSATVSVILTGAVPAGTTANVLLTTADTGVQVPGLLSIPEGKSSGSAVVITTRGLMAEKLVAITASYNGRSAYSNLRVRPDSVTPPPPPGVIGGPTISGYLNEDGSPATVPAYGQILRIVGQAFGTQAGVVTWQGGAVPVLSWADTEIRVRLPSPAPPVTSEFSVTRPDGQFADLMLPLDLPARVPGSAKRR